MRIALIVFFASLACAQTRDRVFDLTAPETAREFQEIASTIRALADIEEISVDAPRKRITVQGNGGQIRLAQFLVDEFDKPAPVAPASRHEFRMSGASPDLVRVFYLDRIRTPQEMQEAVVLIRVVSGMTHIFLYNRLHAAALRGNDEQIALAAWVVNELNKPERDTTPAGAGKTGETHVYKLPEGEAVRLFYLVNTPTVERLNQIAVAVRSQADIQRLFTNTPQIALGARATIEQLDRAEQIVREMDQ
jgi:hypothetical protein